MSKKTRRSNNLDNDYEDVISTDRRNQDELLERRRQKRIKNALRSNNIDELIDHYSDSDYTHR